MRVPSFSAALLLGAAMVALPLVASADNFTGAQKDLKAEQSMFSAVGQASGQGESTSMSSFSAISGKFTVAGAKRNSQFLSLTPPSTTAETTGETTTTGEATGGTTPQPAIPEPTTTEPSTAGGTTPQPGIPQPAVPEVEVEQALQFFPLDTNGDGRTDQWGADRNGDGWFDVLMVDANGDGNPEVTLFDDNFNQIIDAKLEMDALVNGRPAGVWLFDDNEDGYIDYFGFDWNQDGEIDEFQPA